MSADCTGEPPGLFKRSTTAGARLIEKAAAIARSRPASVMPPPRNGMLPITPDSLMAGTIVLLRQKPSQRAPAARAPGDSACVMEVSIIGATPVLRGEWPRPPG